MLDLVFTGIGSAFCPQLGNTSAFFWKGDRLYLLDCGSLVFAALENNSILARAKDIFILLTHTHADHSGSLGTLISYCKHVRTIPVSVVHPESDIKNLLRYNGIKNKQYSLYSGMRYSDEYVSVEFLPVPHTKSLNAYGMTVSDPEETIYYSGDAGDVPADVWQGFIKGQIARIYQDVSLTGKMGGSHADFHWFVSNCPEECRKRFYPIHMDASCKQQAEQHGFGQAVLLCPSAGEAVASAGEQDVKP